MATTGTSVEDAMNRIATLLGGGQSQSSTSPTPAVATVAGSGSSTSPLTVEEQQAIATQVYYSLRVPPITRADMLDMEQSLPDLVDFLRSLASRPTVSAELNGWIASAKGTPQRSDQDLQRVNALAQAIAQDAFGSKDVRVIPIIMAGLAFFMAGYTIAHGWKS